MPFTIPADLSILILGAGGREHCLAWKLAESKSVLKVYVAPGNGGTQHANNKISNVPQIDVTDMTAIQEFIRTHKIGLVVPGPEVPLVNGITDMCQVPCFGPSKYAAQLEGSKAFSKAFMVRNNIPTAEYKSFTSPIDAKQFLHSNECFKRVVVKASGLAAGKGVLLPESVAEAVNAIDQLADLGNAADEIVIEEFLDGNELSVLGLCDGHSVFLLPAAQDHKRIFDGDLGPNTGGMGAYAPAPLGTPKVMQYVRDHVFMPTLDAIRKDGHPFIGILYAGLMVTHDFSTIKTLEFNVRFGDPETQAIIPLFDGDLARTMLACTSGCLDAVVDDIKIHPGAACTVVAASKGYPGPYTKGVDINIQPIASSNVHVFHAGTKTTDQNKLVTNGGRVLSVTATGHDLKEAVDLAYQTIRTNVQFEGMHFRSDIAHRALRSVTKPAASYKDAGVSIDNGNTLVTTIKPYIKSTQRPGSNAEIGGFGGLFDLKLAGYDCADTLLVMATDGVGTKLKLALEAKKHDSIGIDLVAMNVNDLIVQGAEPLVFLDYYACSRLQVRVAADVVRGIAAGCVLAKCALVGGETAEMPGMYAGEEYDLAGFCVGGVARSMVLPRMDLMQQGDVLLGITSSGVHSNGYSLVRHIIDTNTELKYTDACPWDASEPSIAHALLEPTRIYVQLLMPAIRSGLVSGLAHITGGGLLENIPRVLPAHLSADIDGSSWPVPPVFKWLQATGNVQPMEMLRTFNCGIGMVLIVSPANVEQVLQLIPERVFQIGRLVDTIKNGERVTVSSF